MSVLTCPFCGIQTLTKKNKVLNSNNLDVLELKYQRKKINIEKSSYLDVYICSTFKNVHFNCPNFNANK